MIEFNEIIIRDGTLLILAYIYGIIIYNLFIEPIISGLYKKVVTESYDYSWSFCKKTFFRIGMVALMLPMIIFFLVLGALPLFLIFLHTAGKL